MLPLLGKGTEGGRPGNYPDRQLQGPGWVRGRVAFKEAAEYDLANNGMDYYGGDDPNPDNYPLCCAYSNAGYEAHQNSIFQLDDTHPLCIGTHHELRGGTPPNNVWQGHQGPVIPLTMNLPGHQGQQVQPPAPGPPGGGQNVPAAAAAP